jgi:hypothetical protein
MSSWRPLSSRSSVQRLLRTSRSEAPEALVRELAQRVAAAAPERRSRAGWACGGVAGAGIVTAALALALALVGAARYPVSFVSGVATRVSGDAVLGGQKQASLRMVSMDAASSQYQTTTISTQLSASAISPGGSAYDTATLSGQTKTAGGTVTYAVYTNSSCTAGARSAGTVTVTKGHVPNSNALTFNTPGTFYWQAVYSGDAANSGSSSDCTSEVLKVANTPRVTTSLFLTVINKNATAYDKATLSGATANAGGTVTYTVYTNSSCTAGARSAGTVTVTNGQVPQSNTLSFTNGTYYWIAAYSGDANNNAASSACGSEIMSIHVS